jgi:hypothetical protein
MVPRPSSSPCQNMLKLRRKFCDTYSDGGWSGKRVKLQRALACRPGAHAFLWIHLFVWLRLTLLHLSRTVRQNLLSASMTVLLVLSSRLRGKTLAKLCGALLMGGATDRSRTSWD